MADDRNKRKEPMKKYELEALLCSNIPTGIIRICKICEGIHIHTYYIGEYVPEERKISVMR